MLVTDKHTLARPPHAMKFIMLFQSLETRQHRGIFFWLVLFGAECVVGQRVETDCLRLFGVEGFGDYGSVVFQLVVV